MQTDASEFVLCEEGNTQINIREEKDVSNLQEVACGGVDWIDLAQDRDRCQTLVNAIMNFRIP